VLQASPADARKAVREPNDSAVQGRSHDEVGEAAREVGRPVLAGRFTAEARSADGVGPKKPFIGGGRSAGWALASLPSEPATSSAAVQFDPMTSGAFLHIGSDTEIVDVLR